MLETSQPHTQFSSEPDKYKQHFPLSLTLLDEKCIPIKFLSVSIAHSITITEIPINVTCIGSAPRTFHIVGVVIGTIILYLDK